MTEWYDAKRLFQDADARQLVKALWNRQDFRQAGSTLFCRCPTGHKETRLDHCAVYKEGCKCFSCGAHYTVKEMIEKYFGDATFAEVCGRIADTIGTREMYLIDPKHRKKKYLPVTREELEIIGLYSPPEGKEVPTVTDLYKADKKGCLTWIKERAREFMKKYFTLLGSEENQDLRAEYERRYNVTKKIVERL